MKFTAKLVDIKIDFDEFLPKITFLANDKSILQELEQYSKKDKLSIELKEYKEKRGLRANNYLWVLCNELAQKLGNGLTKIDVYKKAIKDAGVFEYQLIADKAVDKFKAVWESKGIGYIVETVESKNGLTKLMIYYGSSVYDVKEFSRIVDNVVFDCREQGINVDTEEIERMKEEKANEINNKH